MDARGGISSERIVKVNLQHIQRRSIPVKQRLGIRRNRTPPIYSTRRFERGRNEDKHRLKEVIVIGNNRTSKAKGSIKDRLGPLSEKIKTTESEEPNPISFTSQPLFKNIEVHELEYEEKENENDDNTMQNIFIWREMFYEAEAKNIQLQCELDKAKSDLKNYVTLSNFENDNLKLQLSKQQKVLDKTDQAKVNTLEQTIVNLKREASEFKEQRNNVTTLIREKDCKLESLQAKYAQLEQQQIAVQQSLKTFEAKYAQIQLDKVAVQQSFKTVEAKYARLEQEKLEVQKSFETLTNKVNTETKQTQKFNLSLLTAKTQVEKELKDKEHANIQLSAKLSQNETKLAEITEAFGSKYEISEIILAEEKASNAELSSKLKRNEAKFILNEGMSLSKINGLEVILAENNRFLYQKANVIKELEKKIQELQTSQSLDYQKLDQEKGDAVISLEKFKAKYEQILKCYRNLVGGKTKIENELQQKQNMIFQLEANHSNELDKLQHAIEALSKEKNQLVKNLEDKDKKWDIVKTEYSKLFSRWQENETKLAEMMKNYTKLFSRWQETETKLAEMMKIYTSNFEDLESIIFTNNNNLTEKAEVIQELEKKISSLESILTTNQSASDTREKHAETQRSELTQKLFNTNVEKNVLEITLQKAIQSKSVLEADFSKAQEDLKNMTAELDDTKFKINELNNDIHKQHEEKEADLMLQIRLLENKELDSDLEIKIELLEKESRELKSKIQDVENTLKIEASNVYTMKNQLEQKTIALDALQNEYYVVKEESKRMRNQLKDYQNVTEPGNILKIYKRLQHKKWDIPKQRSFLKRKFEVKQRIDVDENNFVAND